MEAQKNLVRGGRCEIVAYDAKEHSTIANRHKTAFVFSDLKREITKKRGKVLRNPRSGPGLLIIEGQQHRFFHNHAWKSEVPPKPGVAVDVMLDHEGQVLAITAVSDSQLAKERAQPSHMAMAKTAGVNILRKIAARFGTPSARPDRTLAPPR
jgi:hypothetical protein